MTLNIKLDSLRTFLCVAQAGSLSEAARQLGRTPSAVSMSLKQLTQQLGAELFESERKNTLTPLGQFVAAETTRAVRDFDQTLLNIQRYKSGDSGTVKIASVPSVATRLLPDVFFSYKKQSPNVYIELRDIDSSAVAHHVSHAYVDLGIASITTASQNLLTEPLLEEPFGVVCRHDNVLCQKEAITWKQLKNQPFISNGLCSNIKHNEFQQVLDNAQLHIVNTSSLLQFVEQGMGITLLPRLALPPHSGIRFIPLTDKTVTRKLYLMQHKQHQLSTAAEKLKEVIIGRVGNVGHNS